MPSPFPGMDPYIEQPALWPDFYSRLANQVSVQLNAVLPSEYFASLEPRIEIGIMDEEDTRAIFPDVAMIEGPQVPETPSSTAIAAAPLQIPTVLGERMKVTTVHIHHAPSERLITVIEILSPINKRMGNSAHDEYVDKRTKLLDAPVHLLEIDLLRKGARVPMAKPLPSSPYFIILSRANRRPMSEVWPLQLTDPLPTVPVPLLRDDPDVPLDMSAAVSEVYMQARYERRINYTQPPPGPLTEDESAWVKTLLAEKP